jgi:hypothetical protein
LAKRWAAFLDNHREAIAAMDFFTVATLTFGVLHCFFVIAHDRRRILHCNVTRHPSSLWITQRLREAFPYDAASSFEASAATPLYDSRGFNQLHGAVHRAPDSQPDKQARRSVVELRQWSRSPIR